MKAVCTILFIVFAVSANYAQKRDSVYQDTLWNEEKVFLMVDQSAEFPGGIDGMTKFLLGNISYPAKAKKKNIQGKVYIKFIVEKDGSLSNIEVVKGVAPLLDEEAIRIVSISPAWIPAKQSEKIVRSQFVLPISFILYK